MIPIPSLSTEKQLVETHSSQGLSTAKKDPKVQRYFRENGNTSSILKRCVIPH